MYEVVTGKGFVRLGLREGRREKEKRKRQKGATGIGKREGARVF